MKTYHLDPKKFPRVRRNIIITYIILALVGLGIIFLYLREALFRSAWGLIPFVFLLFTIAGGYALWERKKYWQEFEIAVKDSTLTLKKPKTPPININRSKITGIREVHQGLVLSTKNRENAFLIPKDLPDEDYQALKVLLQEWVEGSD